MWGGRLHLKTETSIPHFRLSIFDNPSRNSLLMAAHHFPEMTNTDRFNPKQGPSEREEISQLGQMKDCLMLFIKIDNGAHRIIHVDDLWWLLLKRNVESVFWPFIRLARLYQWIDGSISHCLVWQGKKRDTHTILLTEYDRAVKVNRGRGVSKHLHRRWMILRLMGNGLFDLIMQEKRGEISFLYCWLFQREKGYKKLITSLLIHSG